MPIQAPQWTDYLNCPVCCREFGPSPRSPVSLGCGHTICRHCLNHLHKKQCPFDQTVIQFEPDELVVNTALLQLAGYSPPPQPQHPPCIQALSDRERQAYDVIIRCMEQLAVYLKYSGNGGTNTLGSRLSRPMQRKLVTVLQCAVTDEEARGRMARAARSLGERTVTELILQHQNPQQISAYLWAAVRARGCQFLGPAMQEEVLKLVLLALEDGSALSRKVLVMFVVQRLKPHFPQASKTSIGHVVQLLYRASCFKVSKRESDSSLMQLKEEFRTYDSLRREHDAQIVQIATESGLRIAPDQWSALLYGDTAHKSHMQSIIDKLQSPQSFLQSVQELFIALHRTGDPAKLVVISMHLEKLASIDASPDVKAPSWQLLAEVMTSLKEVVSGLSSHLQQQNREQHHHKHLMVDRTDSSTSQTSPHSANAQQKFEALRSIRIGEDEMERHRHWPQLGHHPILNGNLQLTLPQALLAIPSQNMPQAFDTYNGNGAQNKVGPPGVQMQQQIALQHPNYYQGYAIPMPIQYAGLPGAAALHPPNGEMQYHEMMHHQHFIPLPEHMGPQRYHAGLHEEQAEMAYIQNVGLQQPLLAHMPYQHQQASSPPIMPNMIPSVSHRIPLRADEGIQAASPQQSANGDMMHAARYPPERSGNHGYPGGPRPTYAQKAAMRADNLAHNPHKRQGAEHPQELPNALEDGNPSAARQELSNGDKMFASYYVQNNVQSFVAKPFPRREMSNIQYQPSMPNLDRAVGSSSPYNVDKAASAEFRPEYMHLGPVYEPRHGGTWSQNNDVFNFGVFNEGLPNLPSTSNGIFGAVRRPLSNANEFVQADDDQELKEELLALEQRICTEFKSAD